MSFHLEKQPMTGDSSSRQRYISIDCSDVVSHSEKKNKKTKHTVAFIPVLWIHIWLYTEPKHTIHNSWRPDKAELRYIWRVSIQGDILKKKWHLLKMITDRIRPLFRWQTDLNTFAHHRFWNIDEVLAVTTYTLYT